MVTVPVSLAGISLLVIYIEMSFNLQTNPLLGIDSTAQCVTVEETMILTHTYMQNNMQHMEADYKSTPWQAEYLFVDGNTYHL